MSDELEVRGSASPPPAEQSTGIDQRRLFQIATDLPEHEINLDLPLTEDTGSDEGPPDDPDSPPPPDGATTLLGIYAEMHAALTRYMAADKYAVEDRPTLTTSRASLRRLDAAFVELVAAWEETDHDARDTLTRWSGFAPFAAAEQQKIGGTLPGEDRWTRGVWRIAKARESIAHIGEIVSRVRRDFDRDKPQRRFARRPAGIDDLVDSLCGLFELHHKKTPGKKTRRSTSRNNDGVVEWLVRVVAVLPESLRPTRTSLQNAVQRSMQAANK